MVYLMSVWLPSILPVRVTQSGILHLTGICCTLGVPGPTKLEAYQLQIPYMKYVLGTVLNPPLFIVGA